MTKFTTHQWVQGRNKRTNQLFDTHGDGHGCWRSPVNPRGKISHCRHLVAIATLLTAVIIIGCWREVADAPSDMTSGNSVVAARLPTADGSVVTVELAEGEEPFETPPSGRLYSDVSSLPEYRGIGGAKLLVAGEFLPHGALFRYGARLRFPLPAEMDPAERLGLVAWHPEAERWLWLGEEVSISPDGKSAIGVAPHFSTLGVAQGPPVHAGDALLVRAVQDGTHTWPVRDAKVEILWEKVDETLREAVTDIHGEVHFSALPGSSGKYRVRVSANGYETTTQPFEKLFQVPVVLTVGCRRINAPPNDIVTFHLSHKQRGDLRISFAEFRDDLSAREAESVRKLEYDYYRPDDQRADRWELVAPGTEIKALNSKLPGYVVAANEPTRRQFCGGLTLSPLVGGPYVMPTNEAWKVVQRYGRRIEQDWFARLTHAEESRIEPGDVVVFHVNGDVKHFALVESCFVDGKRRIRIFTKDQNGLVWRGFLDRWPREGYGTVDFYRVPWDEIDVWREDDPLPSEEPVTPQYCIEPREISWQFDVPFVNALIRAADEGSRSVFDGARYQWNASPSDSEVSGLNEVPQITTPTLGFARFSTYWIRWYDPKDGKGRWLLSVYRFQDNALCDAVLNCQQVRWLGWKLSDFQQREVLGVTTYRVNPDSQPSSAQLQASSFPELDAALANNRLPATASLMWRLERHMLILTKILASKHDPALSAERDQAMLVAENLLGVINRNLYEGGVAGPRRPVGFPGRKAASKGP